MSDLNFVSLFSGAGGLDIGFEMAGWECLYALDNDPIAVATLDENKGRRISLENKKIKALDNSLISHAEVSVANGKQLLREIGRRRGDVAALVGGPPCQSWSSAGNQLGFDDPRGRLFRDYLRVANELDVRWLVFENVRGLLTARGHDGVPGSALHHIRQSLLDAGFQTEVNLLNAADFGVPQRRVRLFMIGFRRGDRPHFPEATHAQNADLLTPNRDQWITIRKCLESISPLKSEEIIKPSVELARLLSAVPNGSGLKSPGKAEATRPGGHWGYKQGCFIADLNLPARTVTASSQQDWVRDPNRGIRRLAPRECAAIQSFPVEWSFTGNRTAQYRQIGNAVPPMLSRAVAAALGEHVSTVASYRKRFAAPELLPLRPALASAIEYTRREEARNGESRRMVVSKRSRRQR
ncbi:MAG: DNA cytosine methyltransferase [Terriglobia bacterium]|nr:DNA cytosine methyltransferase [Terriglobia bacterium]